MNIKSGFHGSLRFIGLLVMVCTLSGCVYWMRAYQVYLQMSKFDQYFNINVSDDFTLHFKEPIMLSEDFVSLSKLHSSEETVISDGKKWRYWFRKVNGYRKPVTPEIKFYSDLNFNKDNKLNAWAFSSLFLQIAPPKFLEASLRSLGGADINKAEMQLQGNTNALDKISADLPKKAAVVAQLGKPFEIQQDKGQEIYVYLFMLDTPQIEKGYEDRALSEVKLSFDKKTDDMVRMAGRFAGLKISINYKKFLDKPAK
jgi:hypothetical protein